MMRPNWLNIANKFLDGFIRGLGWGIAFTTILVIYSLFT